MVEQHASRASTASGTGEGVDELVAAGDHEIATRQAVIGCPRIVDGLRKESACERRQCSPPNVDAAQPAKRNRSVGSYGCKPSYPFYFIRFLLVNICRPLQRPTQMPTSQKSAGASMLQQHFFRLHVQPFLCGQPAHCTAGLPQRPDTSRRPRITRSKRLLIGSSIMMSFRALVNSADESHCVALSDGNSTTRKFVLRPLVIFRYANVNKFARRHIQIETRVCNRRAQIIRFKRKRRSSAISI